MIFLYVFPLSCAAGLGIFLNGAYYRTSFLHSGYGYFYSLLLAVAFMLFESILWLYIGKNVAINVLKVSIVVFSISITLGAQFFSTSLKESETVEKIFNTADVSGDVQYYRDQVRILNERKDTIIEQQRIFGTDRNKSLLESTNLDIEKYELKLTGADDKKENDIEKINSPKTIYSWLAYDLTEIFHSGWSENFVRIIFQLFSSVLLALMAPVSLSMIRMTINKGKAETEQLAEEQPTTSDEIEHETPIKKEPKKKKQDIDKKHILEMLLYYYPERGILPPEKAASYFVDVHKGNDKIPEYSEEQCNKVYEVICPLDGMDKEEIIKEVLNV